VVDYFEHCRFLRDHKMCGMTFLRTNSFFKDTTMESVNKEVLKLFNGSAIACSISFSTALI
jgi:hypothetical protein